MEVATARLYGLAVLATGVALVPWLVDRQIAPSPFVLCVAAVAVSSWYGGLGPGLLSSALGLLASAFLYMSPGNSLALSGVRVAIQLAVFFLVAAAISWLNGERRQRSVELQAVLQAEREAVAEARTAETTLKALINASPLSIVTLDTESRVRSWNAAAERIFGWTEEEVLGKRAPTVSEEDLPASDAVFSQVLDGEAVTGLERRRRRKDGSTIDVSISTAPIVDAEGRVTGTVVLAEDISSRRRADGERLQLLESEREAREIAERSVERARFLEEATSALASSLDYEATLAAVARMAVPRMADWCSVHIVDEDGTVRQLAVEHVDPSKVRLAAELSERYPFDPNGQSGAPLVMRTGEPELIPTIPDELLELVSPDPYILKLLRELGLKSSMAVPLTARGRMLGAISFISAESGREYGPDDLTLAQDLANRAAIAIDNAALYRQVARVAAERSAILRQLTEGIVIADPGGRIVFANDAARRIFGIRGQARLDALGGAQLSTGDGTEVAPDALPVARAALKGEATTEIDLQVRRADGSTLLTASSAIPIMGEEGARLGAVMTIRDVTAQRTLERQKDEFLSAAAHDLKNPLATIKTMAQLLRRRVGKVDTPEGGRLIDGLERIDITATRMAAAIDELLDVTRSAMQRPLDLERRTIDLVGLIDQIVADQRHTSARHHIRFEHAPPAIEGEWDALRLRRAFDNLITNAIKYSPNGGEVRIRAEVNGGDAVVSVEDEGIGIPQGDLSRVFERFYRADNAVGRIPGTGIGLASVRQIVDEHGGDIVAASGDTGGTTMTLRLPLRPAPIANEGERSDERT